MPDPTGPGGAPPSVGFTLSQLGLATSRGFATLVGSIGLEPRQFAVLRAARQHVGSTQQAIAERLAIPASTMVGIVDDLESAGLLTRVQRGSDRRAHTLRLTRRGTTLLDRAIALAARRESELCAGLSSRERATLLELLGRVAERLGIEPGSVPDAGRGI